MFICSNCGGEITIITYAVYRHDGGSIGQYRCTTCGATKEWEKPGTKPIIIQMK